MGQRFTLPSEQPRPQSYHGKPTTADRHRQSPRYRHLESRIRGHL